MSFDENEIFNRSMAWRRLERGRLQGKLPDRRRLLVKETQQNVNRLEVKTHRLAHGKLRQLDSHKARSLWRLEQQP
jgi:hypothetical protein